MKVKLSTIIILVGIYCSSILTSCTPNNPQPNTNTSSTHYWEAATPFPGTSGFHPTGNTPNRGIKCMASYNNDLIIGGNFTNVGGIVAHSIAKWNGVNWSNIGIGNFLNTEVIDMVVYNNKLYFTADKLYVWDGSVLNEFYYSNPNTNNTFLTGTDLHVFNGKLHLLSANDIYIYDGTNVSTLHTPFPTEQSGWSTLECLGDFNNNLFYGTNTGIYKYDNNTWTNINGITSSPPAIIDMQTYNNELYVLGYFNNIGGLTINNNIAKYNGTSWSTVNVPLIDEVITFPLSGYNKGLNHMNVINNELYITHSFYKNGDINHSPSIKYNGVSWSPVAQNYSYYGACVHLHNNTLYCGGDMSMWGTTTALQDLGNLVKLN